jgi:formylglycine-generating enzyme required for sulfatase activity
VRDGEQFYISKASFGKYVSIDNKDENNFILRKTHILKPLESEWAEYAPAPPHDIAFNPASAKFAKKDFKNITAVGWLIRRELSGPEKVYSSLRPPFAMKWSAFRCDAVVSAPKDQDSFYVPMIRLKDLGLSFSKDEITFQQWEKVRRASVTNQYCYDLGDLNYSFVRDGSMGSMRADDRAHSAAEPLTDIEWIDAVTFCNALSELEGLEPCYYLDAEFKKVLRRPINRAMREEWSKRPAVYWKTDADGYRLPTRNEWAMAAGKVPASIVPADSTHAAGTVVANENGLRDFFGNVWEYVWDSDSGVIDDGSVGFHTVMGGSFESPSNPPAKTLSPFPERPCNGHYSIGFRIVKGVHLPGAKAQGDPPSWTVRKGDTLEPSRPMDKARLAEVISAEIPFIRIKDAGLANETDFTDPVDNPNLGKKHKMEMAANEKFLGRISEEQYRKILEGNKIEEKPRAPYELSLAGAELPYRAWKLVKAWAENNGYSFNYSGDMGSMRHSTDNCYSHSQDEPVTFISWHDALVWCNALSEIFGKNPVYFNDQERRQPYKQAILFRLDMFDAKNGTPILPWELSSGKSKGRTAHSGAGVKIFFDGASDGFRLPINEEFKLAEASGKCVPPEKEWTAANSKDKTQPVSCGCGAGFLSGMKGNVLEWGWDGDTQYFHPQNSMYEVNGGGYFYEDINAPRKKNYFYTDYTANAKSIIGMRVSSR